MAHLRVCVILARKRYMRNMQPLCTKLTLVPLKATGAATDCITMELLKHVPVFPRSTLDRMLRRYNLVWGCAISGHWFTDPKVRTSLSWSKEALIKHKGVKTRLRTINSLGSLELNGDLLRFGFLVLVKSSQAAFPPQTHSKVFKVEGLTLLQSRYHLW